MSELRWILLLIAIAVFFGTVLWSRISKESRGRELFSESSKAKDSLDKELVYADDEVEIEEDFGVSEVRILQRGTDSDFSEDVSGVTQNTAPNTSLDVNQDVANASDKEVAEGGSEESQYIAVLHVTAPAGATFSSKKICRTLEHLGLKHGKYKIYHRESLQNSELSLFSVANMVKPGYFEPDAEETFSTPGISFFLVLPGPPDPIITFNEMVQTAKQVAQTLEGNLIDSDRSTFTTQRSQLIRDEIASFIHRINDE